MYYWGTQKYHVKNFCPYSLFPRLYVSILPSAGLVTGSALPTLASLLIIHTQAESGAYSRDSSRFDCNWVDAQKVVSCVSDFASKHLNPITNKRISQQQLSTKSIVFIVCVSPLFLCSLDYSTFTAINNNECTD